MLYSNEKFCAAGALMTHNSTDGLTTRKYEGGSTQLIKYLTTGLDCNVFIKIRP